jgi:CDP-6-deoxy-D-xylo-4-hexulose-3-dehydrase
MIPLMKSAFLHEHETRMALAEFIMTTNRLSMDAQCRDFEREFGAFQARSESVLFNSGGSANLALLQALKNLGRIQEGDRIGFSALTWSTNVMPILQMGMVPVPVDCEPATLNISSTTVRQRMNRADLKALFATNALGFTGDLDAIAKLCREAGIVFIEDNCESLGTELPQGKAGNFGVAASFSFFIAHHMSTIEGGMVCTDDGELAEMLRIVRANGWDRNLTAEQQHRWRRRFAVTTEFDAKYTFYDLGYNLRPTEITGFLGRHQLKFLEENITRRERNYLRLEREARANADLLPLEHGHIKRLSNFAFPVLCTSAGLRQKYFAQFSGAGVEIRPVIAGDIQKQPFYSKYVKESWDLPGAKFIDACGFYCGNYPELTETDLETLASCLRSYE